MKPTQKPFLKKPTQQQQPIKKQVAQVSPEDEFEDDFEEDLDGVQEFAEEDEPEEEQEEDEESAEEEEESGPDDGTDMSQEDVQYTRKKVGRPKGSKNRLSEYPIKVTFEVTTTNDMVLRSIIESLRGK